MYVCVELFLRLYCSFIDEGVALVREDELNRSFSLAVLADDCFLLALFIILLTQFLCFLKAAVKLFFLPPAKCSYRSVRWGQDESC